MAASVSQVTKVVETMSLANPHVSFSYTSNGMQVLHLPCQTRRERIEAVLGLFHHEAINPSLWGLFGDPQGASSRRSNQFLFINQRAVFSPLIAKAVQAGYGTRIKENTYPSFVLFLEMDPADVDVNVHPQKKEVRLKEESLLFKKVERFVSGMFIEKQETPYFASPLTFEAPPPFSFQEDFAPYVSAMEQAPLPFELKERGIAVFGKYLLLEKEGWVLVDLNAAFARVCFDTMKDGTGGVQALLWPLEAVSEDPEMVSQLEKIGFECRWIGNKKIAVDALPSCMDAEDFPLFFDSWKEGKKLEVAVCNRGKKRYSLEEALSLFRSLQKCQDFTYDPLGKKIWKNIQQVDLAAWIESTN